MCCRSAGLEGTWRLTYGTMRSLQDRQASVPRCSLRHGASQQRPGDIPALEEDWKLRVCRAILLGYAVLSRARLLGPSARQNADVFLGSSVLAVRKALFTNSTP